MIWTVLVKYPNRPTRRHPIYLAIAQFRYRGDAIVAVKALNKSAAHHRRGLRYCYRMGVLFR